MIMQRLFMTMWSAAERIPIDELNKPPSEIFYLPHHSVHKNSIATPIRVVFNSSMKTSNGVSLGDQLLIGPRSSRVIKERKTDSQETSPTSAQ